MKKLIGIIFLSSFIFSGVSFNQSTVFGDLDDNTTVGHAMGVDFDMNDKMSIGYDTAAGMLIKADAPLGLNLRLGYHGNGTSTFGVGMNWWSGGEGIETSISTVVDYSTSGSGTDETTVRINLNWGF